MNYRSGYILLSLIAIGSLFYVGCDQLSFESSTDSIFKAPPDTVNMLFLTSQSLGSILKLLAINIKKVDN